MNFDECVEKKFVKKIQPNKETASSLVKQGRNHPYWVNEDFEKNCMR